MPAYELIEDRNAVYRETDARSMIVDNCWNGGIVVGEVVEAGVRQAPAGRASLGPPPTHVVQALSGDVEEDLRETRFGDIKRSLAFVDLGSADEFFLEQIAVARVIRLRLREIGLRHGELAFRGSRTQLQIAGIHAGERRARFHRSAHIHQPLGDFAPHAKAQGTLAARAHFTGKRRQTACIARRHRLRHHQRRQW